MGLFSVSKSSTTQQQQTTNNYDQRQVNDAGGGIIGNGDSINNSTNLLDLTSVFDGSNRSTNDSGNTLASWSSANTNSGNTSNVNASRTSTTTNYTSNGTDPGVSSINATNAELLATLGDQQGDALKVIAGLGTNGIRQMGESATSLFGTAEQNSAQVWTHTLDASQEAMDKMFTAASGVLGASTQLAQGAMQTYQPADSKASDNQTKVAILGVIAVIVAAFIQARKG